MAQGRSNLASKCVPAVASVWALGASMACAPVVVDAFEPPEPAPIVCAEDSAKTEPGVCGCDVPDDDFDGDGTLDCLEECPDNIDRLEPAGACGCSSLTDTAGCDELRAAARNVYTFDGTGTTIVDTKSGANGTLSHTLAATPLAALEKLQINGRLRLDGLGSYVELPERLISSLDSATFEMWISWYGGDPWTRIFDFGDNGGDPVNGVTYLFLTPSNTGNVLRVAYSVAGPSAETVADGAEPLPVHDEAAPNAPDHVAVVIDRESASMRLYSAGVEVRSVTLEGELSAINDVNNWLGRSNYAVDPPVSATLVEFRIYDRALTAAQIRTSFQAGPGALE
jgi:hypothetical protein